MITVDVRSDRREVEQLLRGIRDGAPRVLSTSINRTLTTVQARAAREIAKDLKLKVSIARKALGRERATRRSLTGEVFASGRRIPLIQFGASQTTAGVTYDVGQGRRLIPRAFINTAPPNFRKQHPKAVYKRVEAGGGKLVPRDPIFQKFGPSIPTVFISSKIQKAMQAVARARWVVEVNRQIHFVLLRPAGGRNG